MSLLPRLLLIPRNKIDTDQILFVELIYLLRIHIAQLLATSKRLLSSKKHEAQSSTSAILDVS